MENYRRIRKIGSGNFAKVYLAVHEKSGRQVALKLVEKKANRNPMAVRRISREMENMKVLEGHRNIVRVVDSKFTNYLIVSLNKKNNGMKSSLFTFFLSFFTNLAFEDSKYFGIAMEYVPGGELFDFVQMEEGMSETSARDMLKKIISGVQHCHKNGITHRDLKLENILLDEFQEPKVTIYSN